MIKFIDKERKIVMSSILDKAKLIEDYIINFRRELHENPELSGQEFKTQEKIMKELDKLGIPYKKVFNRKKKRWRTYFIILIIVVLIVQYLILLWAKATNHLNLDEDSRMMMYQSIMILVGFMTTFFVLVMQLRVNKSFEKLRRSVYWHNMEFKLHVGLVLLYASSFIAIIDLIGDGLLPGAEYLYILKIDTFVTSWYSFFSIIIKSRVMYKHL